MIENKEGGTGGSGGDTGMSGDAGNQVKSAKGTYQIGGNQVFLVSRQRDKEPAVGAASVEDPPESRIVLLAGGSAKGGFVDGGTVDVRGCKGVRITSGPLAIPHLSAEVSAKETDGVDIVACADQKIRIQQSVTPGTVQLIEMASNSITIDAGISGSLTLKAGQSSIVINSSGITITGMPLIQKNSGAPPNPSPPFLEE